MSVPPWKQSSYADSADCEQKTPIAKRKKQVIPPGIEPGTLSVLDSRDNRYTTESKLQIFDIYIYLNVIHLKTENTN